MEMLSRYKTVQAGNRRATDIYSTLRRSASVRRDLHASYALKGHQAGALAVAARTVAVTGVTCRVCKPPADSSITPEGNVNDEYGHKFDYCCRSWPPLLQLFVFRKTARCRQRGPVVLEPIAGAGLLWSFKLLIDEVVVSGRTDMLPLFACVYLAAAFSKIIIEYATHGSRPLRSSALCSICGLGFMPTR